MRRCRRLRADPIHGCLAFAIASARIDGPPPIVITYTTKLKLQEVRLIYFILSPVALLYYSMVIY